MMVSIYSVHRLYAACVTGILSVAMKSLLVTSNKKTFLRPQLLQKVLRMVSRTGRLGIDFCTTLLTARWIELL